MNKSSFFLAVLVLASSVFGGCAGMRRCMAAQADQIAEQRARIAEQRGRIARLERSVEEHGVATGESMLRLGELTRRFEASLSPRDHVRMAVHTLRFETYTPDRDASSIRGMVEMYECDLDCFGLSEDLLETYRLKAHERLAFQALKILEEGFAFDPKREREKFYMHAEKSKMDLSHFVTSTAKIDEYYRLTCENNAREMLVRLRRGDRGPFAAVDLLMEFIEVSKVPLGPFDELH